METTLKPYPKYRGSDHNWLGQIPSHWEVIPCKRIARVNPTSAEMSTMPDSAAISLLPMERVGKWGQLDLSEQSTLAAIKGGLTYMRDGDVIVAKITPCFENGKGALCEGLKNGIGFGSTEFHVLRPFTSKVDAQYLYYLTRSARVRYYGTASMEGAGGQKRVPTRWLATLGLPLPSIPEQRQIACYLDTQISRANRLIRAKQRLIELLNEQKQAIIQRAVTRGLDPDVPLKPSGTDWLEEVPAHWKKTRLKSLFREIDRRSSTGEEVLLSLRMHEGLVPHVEVSDRPISADALIGYKHVRPGELVMNRMRAASGLFAIAQSPGIVSPDYAVFQSRKPLDVQYYLMLFKTPLMKSLFL